MKKILPGIIVVGILVALGWWGFTRPAPAPISPQSVDPNALQQPAVLTKDIVFDGHVLEKVGDAPYYGVQGEQLKVHVDKVVASKGVNIQGDVIVTTTFTNIVVGSSTLMHEFTADLNHTTGWYEVTSYHGLGAGN